MAWPQAAKTAFQRLQQASCTRLVLLMPLANPPVFVGYIATSNMGLVRGCVDPRDSPGGNAALSFFEAGNSPGQKGKMEPKRRQSLR